MAEKRKYLIAHENAKSRKVIGAIVEIPADFTSEEFGALQEDYQRAHGEDKNENPTTWVRMIRIYEDQKTANGIYYEWELSGPGGAWYNLLWFPGVPQSEITIAAHEIRRNYDVVKLEKLHITKMVDCDLDKFYARRAMEIASAGWPY